MILEDMYMQYNILKVFKNELSTKGHGYKQLAWINGQLDLLLKLIKQESFSVLDELVRKTNYRLLKSIDKGMHNLVDIYNNSLDWKLGELKDHQEEFTRNDVLVFSTLGQTLIFSKTIKSKRMKMGYCCNIL